MKRLIPFIFVNDTADVSERTFIETENLVIVTVGAKNYAEAGEVAKEYVDKGAVAIELCSAFGPKGMAIVIDAIEDRVPVGAIRFDKHPGVGQESGDTKFL
jgi:hypothetical protein